MPTAELASTEVSPVSSPFLYAAEQAVAHAQSVIWMAGNKGPDLAASGGGSAVCVVSSRLITPDDKATPRLDRIHRWAARAATTHCGNCAEYAAVAFVFLEKQPAISPLELMQFLNGDHMYVVVGRAAGTAVANPAAWGRLAVVCDPWKNASYPAADLGRFWPGKIPKPYYPVV